MGRRCGLEMRSGEAKPLSFPQKRESREPPRLRIGPVWIPAFAGMTESFMRQPSKGKRRPFRAASHLASNRRLRDGLGQVAGLAEPFFLNFRHRSVGLGFEDRRVDRVDERLVLEPPNPGEV